METTQGISLGSYFYFNLAKTLHFSNYVLWFFYCTIGDQEQNGVGEGVGTSGKGEVAGKGEGG
jgi:hypothetical protein